MAEVVRGVAYRALADELRAEVLAGEYAGGQPLPTESQLAQSHSLSRSTVRRAMQDLVAEGIIYRVAGRGTYPVADNGRYLRHFGSVEDLMALSLDTVCQVIDPLRQRVDLEAAGRLQADSDSVVSLVVQRLYDAVPFSVTSISLPLSVGRLLDGVQAFAEAGARSRLTVIGCLEQRTPRLIANAEQSITAVSAPESAAAYLACAPGSAVLRVDRLYSDAAGTPVELAVSYFDPAYYTYRVRLRRT